jgi:biopolymer transport protein ExbB
VKIFAQTDLVKQQAEINSAKAYLEEARQARDMVVAKRWQEKSKQNEERERIDQQLESKKEKTEAIFSERSRLFEELRIAREALGYANEDAEKARTVFASVFPSQSRALELKFANKGAMPFTIPEVSMAEDSPLQATEILFSLAKKNIEYTEEIEKNDSNIRLGGIGFATPQDSGQEALLVLIDPFLNSHTSTEIANQKEKKISEKFWQFMQDGGILMYPILAMLLIAFFLIAERFFVLFKNGNISEKEIENILCLQEDGKQKELDEHIGKLEGSFGKIAKTIFDSNLKIRENVEKAVEAEFAKMVSYLEIRLPVISILGTTAPLLGLLGTVMGMIELFNVITIHGTADPKLLAGGISIALVTTEAGLSVAIPVHLLHTWIAGRVEKATQKMDYAAMKLVNARFEGLRNEGNRVNPLIGGNGVQTNT